MLDSRDSYQLAVRRISSPILLLFLLILSGCQPLKINNLPQRLQASNYRDWSPQFAELPYAVVSQDGQIQLYNIRNNEYLTENDFIQNHYDRTFSIDDVQSIDFIIVPFKGMEFMAHTMLSFGLRDGTYFGISAEIRTEKGETYSPILGLSNQYELTYVVADERDIIRLRTRYRDADVYIYRTVATPQQSQVLLLDMLQRINQLAQHPEFYDTIRNNCTTNILAHVNRLKSTPLAFSWQVLLPGYSDQYAYDEGLLDQSLPFDELKQNSWINDLAEQFFDDEDFSAKIRRRMQLDRRLSQFRHPNGQ